MNEMKWTSDGKTRKTRKADQMRWNAEMKCFEVYQIDVPVDLEEWEKEGLEKSRALRVKRKAKKKKNVETIHELSQTQKPGNGEKTDERKSGISD